MTTPNERQQRLVEELAERHGLSHEQVLAEVDTVIDEMLLGDLTTLDEVV